ncbi:MAG: cytochrome c biogenesis ATP-binding export protein CcmA [Alphaproteobacteria bacterium]|nr:MAG: cytochrome c biogenesis ATP-binding export protein CcmA [Alphaproteobacteria bacterium]
MQLVGERLAVDRGDRRIFDGVSFAVPAGSALVVTGPNGSGKSTLIKAIAGFLPPAAGSVRLDGMAGADDGWRLAEHCHYLAHDNALKGQLTVAENLSFWQRFLGPGLDIEAALEKVGLPGIGDIPAGYLSAGQKRRVAIARLLVTARPVWLVDEPTAALDAASGKRFADIVRKHLGSGGIVVAATHQDLGLKAARFLALDNAAGHHPSPHGGGAQAAAA